MQYVGARYVPKFMGLYDATQTYEALCVVDNGMGTSYITKVPTPAGTPLTDTDYYAVYGASSGAIINLQNQIGDLNDLNTTDQDSLVDAINEVDADIQTLTALTHKVGRAIVISDSYGKGRGGQTPWTDRLRVYLNLSSADYFAYSEGSLGFNRTGEDGHTAEQLLTAHSGDITDHDTITHVIFGLGLNDTLALTGLDTAIINCIDYVKSEYPNAKIYIGFIGNFKTKTTAELNAFMEALHAYCEMSGRKGVAYITGIENVMHNNNYFIADGIHPTTTGGDMIAKYVSSFVNGGASCIFRSVTEFTSSVIDTATSNIKETINNDVVSLAPFISGQTAAISCTAGTPVTLGTMVDPLLVGIGGSVHYGVVFASDGANWHQGLWYILNGDLAIIPYDTFTIPVGARMLFTTLSYPTVES